MLLFFVCAVVSVISLGCAFFLLFLLLLGFVRAFLFDLINSVVIRLISVITMHLRWLDTQIVRHVINVKINKICIDFYSLRIYFPDSFDLN